MLDNDNIISTSVSGAVEENPTDEKDYIKCSFKQLQDTKSRSTYS